MPITRNQAAHDLEQALVTYVAALRRDLAAATEGVSNFDFTINAQGRVHEGDVQVKFELDDYYGAGVKTSGGRLVPIVEEFIHRSEFKRKNAPLCLPNVKCADDSEAN